MRRLLLPLALLLTFSAATPASAWSAKTRIQMVDEAIRLMPKSLRLVLEAQREAVRRGVLTPMVHEDSAGHHPPWAGGELDASIEAEAQELASLLAERTPFRELAIHFGQLAHYIQDSGFPPAMATPVDGSRLLHFTEFCESRAHRFPLVFYGHDAQALSAPDYREFGLSIMQRARDEDPALARAYAAAGDPPAASFFDDRSIPFAVGSLSYSHSVTDIVRAWLDIWHRAGGDTGRTPYLKKRGS